jgi:hypothetical protein
VALNYFKLLVSALQYVLFIKLFCIQNMYSHLIAGAASGLGRQISSDPKTPGGPSTIAEEAVDQLQENEKLVAGKRRC